MAVRTYTEEVCEIMKEMIEAGLMDDIDLDSKEGRYKLIEKYIPHLRIHSDFIKLNVPLYLKNQEKTDAFIKERISILDDREWKIDVIWNHFIVKVGLARGDIVLTAVICFCIPILLDCWDGKI